MSNILNQEYLSTGCTPIFRVVESDVLLPLQNLIYENIRPLLIDHSSDLPIGEKLRLEFKNAPTKEDFSKFMQAIDGSQEVKDLIFSSAVRRAFASIFDCVEVTPFPISRFRAQFPNLGKTTYNWHQDEGTWYAVPVKDLAYRMPATLWLSINGADETNSIEIVPNSHKEKLFNHYKVEGQGYFNANLPEHMKEWPRKVVCTTPGEGVAFHPLTFHRSVVAQVLKPRFSIDIRYYCEASEAQKYSCDWRLRLKRAVA